MKLYLAARNKLFTTLQSPTGWTNSPQRPKQGILHQFNSHLVFDAKFKYNPGTRKYDALAILFIWYILVYS